VFGPMEDQTVVPVSEVGKPPACDSPESKVIAANVAFYRQIASKYDTYETYLFDPSLQKSLEDDLDKIDSHFGLLRKRPSCLECGGGTGNLTLKMCARGWRITVVDISDDMLDLLREKARAKGHSPELIRSPIEQFLQRTRDEYDIVAFSSVLHHLYGYARVVEQAASRVRAGGFFYSNYDPVVPRRPRLTRAFDSLDIAVAKLLFDSRDVLPGIGRRIRKLFARTDPFLRRTVVSAGDIAEFHVRAGLDDGELVRILQRNGFTVMEHLRYATGRTSAIRFLNQRLRLLESFKIMARRSSR
jgi:2-polyprenyl-3-methyl-5-hydroxy-6-metoxy-1,4-benzoquinol methylase